MPCLATNQPFSEGNDVVPIPFFDNKNAYLDRKWPNVTNIPYVIDSTFGNIVKLCISFDATGLQDKELFHFLI